MALTKVSGGILDPGINVAGIVTATGFDGPFTGGSGSNITAGIITATGFDLNGNGDISGNLVVGGNLTVNGNTTTLDTTLQEVDQLFVSANNTNYAGIITQTGTGNILGLFDGSSRVFNVADGGATSTGALTVTGDVEVVDSSPRIKITDSDATGNAYAFIDGQGGQLKLFADLGNNVGSSKIIFGVDGNTPKMVIDGTGKVGIGSETPSQLLDVGGTIKTANITSDSSNLSIENTADRVLIKSANRVDIADNMVRFQNRAQNATLLEAVAGTSGYVKLFHNDSLTASVTQDALTVTGRTSNSGMIEIASNQGANNNDRFRLHKTSAAERLTIQNYASGNWVENIRITAGGAVELKHSNGSTVLETKGYGIDIAGGFTQSGNSLIADDGKLQFGGASDLRIYHNTVANTTSPPNHLYANSNYIDSHGAGNLFIRTAGAVGTYIGNTDGEHAASFHANGSAVLYWDASERFRTTTDGISVTGDIGSTSAEIGDVYLADDKSVYLGNGQDIRLLYDSSGSTSFTIDSQAGYMYINSDALRLNSRTSSWNYLRGDKSDGVVKLYKSNSQRLATSDTGITVTGEVAASQDYPNFRPTLDFNFAAEKKLDPRITYTRTGPASFTDEFGRVILVGENEPRFDHDPITRECKGLLIEETRTNKISNSNSWNDGVVTDETKSPDGEFNAIKVTGSEGGTTYNEGTSTTGVWSVFLKAGSTNYVQLQGGGVGMNNSTIGPYTKNSIINLSNGTFTVNEQGFTAKQYRDGWWRVSVVYTTGSSYQGTTWSIYCLDSSSPTADTVDNAEHCYVWGEVYEVGSYITSYIPTKYGSATRGDDDLIIDGEDFTDFLNPSEGTIFADYKVIAEDPEIMYLSDNTAARRIGLYEAGSSQTRFLIGNSGTLADTTDSAGTTVGDNIKSAGAYKLNDVAAAKNGVISSTDSSVTIPPDLDRAYIGGYYDGTVQGILGLRRLVYYQQRLPNSQLVTLTA